MPSFFRRKQPPRDSPAFHSVEHLPPPPVVADDLDRRFSVSTNTNNNSTTTTTTNTKPHKDQSHHSFLRRSRSQRHPNPVDSRPGFPSVAAPPPRIVDADPSWPPSPAQPEDQENPRRSRRSLFTFHSSPPSKESVTFPERNQSLRNPSPGAPPRRHQRPLSVDTTDPHHPTREHVRLEKTPQSPMPQDAAFSHDHARPPRSPNPPFIQRSHTDSLENLYRSSPADSSAPRHAAELTPGQHPVDHIRPPSRQSVGPPSPLRPLPVQPDSSSGMSDRPPGGSQGPPPANQGSAQETGYRSGSGQPSEPGRSTPSSQRGREEEIDMKTLLQKHDELQAKYSKVKRYYFEKDAQVQHLQNTVAHQRMAVSRTVLDDNEYASRFVRLDGAIKDLAFSIRKDWTGIPTWLHGYVNEDAPQAGTKEMMAIGRAVMSRWLVEELFERYFHPALDMAFSRQLKSIEMTLRRQQAKTYTDEDKENAIARISNWRRTTLDGLSEALQGPAADEHRTQLIDRLVDGLVATLSAHLCDPPPAGLDSAARMIVENAVGIADKIPLESRDVCIEYVTPGTPIQDATMKVETGIKPLTAPAGGEAARPSTDQDRQEGGGGGGGNGGEDQPQDSDRESAGENRSKGSSVFRSFMNRGGRGAPAGGGGSSNEDAGRPAEERGPARVRLASFVLAEVRGRGPVNVLFKAPVYALE
ncbi:hypothetical protein BDV59DRAFT_39807 [Aspergillus ambiguus]|uniref:uncharacterized protein n=1 Tax=Aspergillus ambiguus TaxID=176160 RepID=UPI003CCD623C